MRATPVLLILLAACGGSEPASTTTQTATTAPAVKPPTTEEAKQVISSSSDLGEYEFTKAAVTIPMKVADMNAPAKESADQLAKGGWLRMKSGTVELTEKSTNDPRFLVRANGFLDVVPIAKKEMGDVTAVRETSEGVDVDFTWKWVPTEVGTTFTSGAVKEMFDKPQPTTATLIRSGDGWVILRLRPSA